MKLSRISILIVPMAILRLAFAQVGLDGDGLPGGGSTGTQTPMLQYQWNATVINGYLLTPSLSSQGWVGSLPSLNIMALRIIGSSPAGAITRPEYQATVTVKFNIPSGVTKHFKFTPNLSMNQPPEGYNGFESLGPDLPGNKSYLISVTGPTTRTFKVNCKSTLPSYPQEIFRFAPSITEDSRSVRIGDFDPNYTKKALAVPVNYTVTIHALGLSGIVTFPSWAAPMPTPVEDPYDRTIDLGIPFQTGISSETERYMYLIAKGYATRGTGKYSFSIDGGDSFSESLPSSYFGLGWDIRTVTRKTMRPSAMFSTYDKGDTGKDIKVNLKYDYDDGVTGIARTTIRAFPSLSTTYIKASSNFRSNKIDKLETCITNTLGAFRLSEWTQIPGLKANFLYRGDTPQIVGLILGTLTSYIPGGGSLIAALIASETTLAQQVPIELKSMEPKNTANEVVEFETSSMEQEYLNDKRNLIKTENYVYYQYWTETRADVFGYAFDTYNQYGYNGLDVSFRYKAWLPDQTEKKKFILRYLSGPL